MPSFFKNVLFFEKLQARYHRCLHSCNSGLCTNICNYSVHLIRESVVPVLGNVCAGVLCSLLDVLFVGELVVIGTEDFHCADIAFETDLLESVGKSLMRQAVTGLIGPQALLISVVLSAAGNILNTVQVPDEDSLAVGLLKGLERGSLAVEVILVKSDTNVRRTDFLDDRESVLETVDAGR